MFLVLDANVLVADLTMRGARFRVLFEGLPQLGATLVVPEPALHETVGRYQKRLESKCDRLKKTERDLHKVLVNQAPDFPEIDVHAEVARYRTFIEQRVVEVGGRIQPYPDVSHKAVTQRAIERRKPFKESGAGYRDFLIWRCVVELASEVDAPVFFVSSNTRDFALQGQLHSDLRHDLVRIEGAANVRLLTGLEEFNEEFLLPQLDALEDIRAAIQEETFEPFDVGTWIEGHIDWLLASEDLLAYGIGVHPGFGSASFPRLREILAIRVKNVRALQSGDILLAAEADLDVEFEANFSWQDYEGSRDVRRLLSGDEPSAGADIPWENEFSVDFELILSRDDYSVVDFEPGDVESKYEYA